ncbi:MAG: hypothetical protein ACI4NJ_01375 [Cellvibrio sp.]
MSIIKQALPLAVLSTIVCHTQASTFQYEVSANFDHYHLDIHKKIEVEDDVYNLTGTYYLAPVETKGHPYAEAGFMARTNNLSLHYAHTTTEISSYSSLDANEHYHDDSTDKSLTAMASFYWFDGWLYTSVGATESRDKYTFITHYNGEVTDSGRGEYHDHWRGQASIGISPFAGLLVYTNFYEGTNFSDSPNLNVQYLHKFETTALATHIRYVDFYDNQVVHFDVDYYLTQAFSIGASYEYTEHFPVNEDWAINSRYFITPSFSIEGAYKDYSGGEAFVFGGSFRF